MASRQAVAQCVQQCVQAANQLRSAVNQMPDNRAREMATSAAAHIEMCIHSCEDAMRYSEATGRF